MIKKLILTAALSATVAGLATPAAAAITLDQARRDCPFGTFIIISEAHGDGLRAGGNDAAGNPVVERPNDTGNGQAVCFVQTGTTNGNPTGYFYTDNNQNRFGVGPTGAVGVSWQNTTDGTLWEWNNVSGGFYLWNHANGGRLTFDNIAGNQVKRKPAGCSGCYQLLNYHAPGTSPGR